MTHSGTSVSSAKPAPDHPRFGCCANMIATPTDPLGLENLPHISELGFDYVELSLRHLVVLGSSDRSDLERRLARAGIACEACNNFFPAEVRLTGPDADLAAARRYAENALAVASTLGAKVVVFGSSGARNVPAGFPIPAARRQLLDLLIALAPAAERHGVTIALEHLCRAESNILNTLAEARALADEVAHPNVRLLVDAYHARCENVPPGTVAELGSRIAHAHVAEGRDRQFPSGGDPFLAEFFRELRSAHYAGRISIEAFTRNFVADGARGLSACRSLNPV